MKACRAAIGSLEGHAERCYHLLVRKLGVVAYHDLVMEGQLPLVSVTTQLPVIGEKAHTVRLGDDHYTQELKDMAERAAGIALKAHAAASVTHQVGQRSSLCACSMAG